ncbi:MAG: hypothetical protein Fur0016_15730 [Anaerolineales bacterium]
MSEISWLDASLYPDVNPPERLETLAEQVDFLARLCSAWDFGILPALETVTEIRKPAWKPAVEACRLLTSPAYHLLRRWHSLPSLPYLGQTIPGVQNDPCLEQV